MLTGFFKEHQDSTCECKVVKFADRVFVDDEGDATFVRMLVIRVESESPSGARGFKMLMPIREPLNLKDISATFFDTDYRFNNRGRNGAHVVTRQLEPIVGATENPSAKEGRVSLDGLDDLVAFYGSSISNLEVASHSLVRFCFPRPIVPGESVAVRLTFAVGSLAENTDVSGKSLRLQLPYYDARDHAALAELGGAETTIPAVITLGAPKGGFDIFVAVPSHQEVNRLAPRNYEQMETMSDGEWGEVRSFAWRARNVLPELGEMVLGQGFTVECDGIRPPDTTADDVVEVKARVKSVEENLLDASRTLSELSGKLRTGTYLSIAALVVGIVALLQSCAAR